MIVGTKWTCPPMLCGGRPDLSGLFDDWDGRLYF